MELGKHRIMVDCGIKPGSNNDDLHPEIDQLDQPRCTGFDSRTYGPYRLGACAGSPFPEIGIYCSEGTAALLPVMLDDCYQHYMRKIFLQRERAKYIANAAPVQEHYYAGERTCGAVPRNQLSVQSRRGPSFWRCITAVLSGWTHSRRGQRSPPRRKRSAHVFLWRLRIVSTVDRWPADWPDEIGDVDLLVLESTYGGREPHRPLEDSRNELVSFVRKTIEEQGSVILASFGLGRAQELLKLIVTRVNTGDLPRVPIYIDGMIKLINPIYRKLASFDLSAEAIYEVTGDTERQEVAIAAQTHPSIIITTSGMLTGGPVLHYMRHLLPDARHRIGPHWLSRRRCTEQSLARGGGRTTNRHVPGRTR